jgi:signal transduction histidine kinase
MNKFYLGFFLLLYTLSVSYANNDSLSVIFRKAKNTQDIDALNRGLLAVLDSRYMPTDLPSLPTTYLLYAERSLQLSEELSYSQGELEALYAIGLYHWHSGLNYQGGLNQKPLSYFERTVAISKNLNNSIFEVKANRCIGKIYHEVGDMQLAMGTLTEAYTLSTKSEKKEGRYNLAIDIGNIYFDSGEPLKALKSFLEALVLAKEANNQHRIAYSMNNVAKAYDKLARKTKAIEQLQEGIEIAENNKDLFCLALLYNTYGSVSNNLNQPEKAIEYYDKALKIVEKIDVKQLRANILQNIAKFYVQNKKYADALEYYLKSVNILESSAPQIYLLDTYQALYEIYNYNKDYQKALTYYKLYTTLKEKFVQEQLDAETGKTDTKEFEQEIEQLTQERENLKQALKNQSLLTYTATGIIAFLFIGLVVLAITFKKRQGQIETLAKQKEELQQVNDLKDKLFSVISQDLRSPLHSLQSVVALLDAEVLNPQEIKLIGEKLGEDLGTTLGLLDNLLYWARSQMQGIRKEIEPINIHDIIDENINLLSGSANKKGVVLHNNVAQTLTKPQADANMISLVIRNLLSNAIKFTPKGGSVNFSAKKTGTWVEVYVTDSGVGMNATAQQRIFNTQAVMNNSFSAMEAGGGIGLGLLLCKEFIEENGGKIWVTSQEGKGTTFGFSLKING